jgi:hypothetical protein
MSLGTVDARQSSEDQPPKPGIGRLLIPVIVVLVVAGLGWWGGRVLGRTDLFVGLAIGLTPILLLSLVRLVRRLSRRARIMLAALVILSGLGTAVVLLGQESKVRGTGAAPGPPIPLAVSASFTSKGTIDSGQIAFVDRLIVPATAMDQIRTNLLGRLESTSDSQEVLAVLRWCLPNGTVPTSWTLPPGLKLSQATPGQVQSVLIDNWDACFDPQKFAALSWNLVEQVDTGYLYVRSTTVAYDSGDLYGVAEIPVDLDRLDSGLALEGREATYDLLPAPGSTMQLTAPGGAVAGVDPATTVNSLPGLGDQVAVPVDEDTASVHVVVLKPWLRNKAGHALYQALLWGPLQWFIGVVTVLFSGILTDVGRSALKWLFVAVFRRRPKPSA